MEPPTCAGAGPAAVTSLPCTVDWSGGVSGGRPRAVAIPLISLGLISASFQVLLVFTGDWLQNLNLQKLELSTA